MVALLLTVGLWLWPGSGEAIADIGISETAASSGSSREAAAVSDISEAVAASSDASEEDAGVETATPGAPQNLVGRFKALAGGEELTSGLNLTSGEELTSGVELTWTPVGGAVEYNVYRRVSRSGTEYRLIGTTWRTSYVDRHHFLPPGFRYQYIVRATAGSLLSEPSNDFQIDVLTFRDLRAEISADGNWVDLSWKLDPPATNVDVLHFDIFRRKASEPSYDHIGWNVCCSYRDRIGIEPLPGAEYVYRVRPTNRYGVVGSWGSSSHYTAVQVPPLAVPGNLVGHFKVPVGGEEWTRGVELTWTPVGGAVEYNVYRRVSRSGTEYRLIGTTWRTSYVDRHHFLPPGFRYQYIVRATAGSLLSEPSNDFQIDVLTFRDLRAEISADGNWVDLSWKLDPPATNVDVLHFDIFRRKTSEPSYKIIEKSACCSYRDRIGIEPLPGAEYVYRVRPTNRYGVVGSSGTSSDYTTVQIPTSKPRARIVDHGEAILGRSFPGVFLSWDDVKGEVTYYEIFRRAAVEGQEYKWVGTNFSDDTTYYDRLGRLTPGVEYYYRIKTIHRDHATGYWGGRSNYAVVRVPALTGLRASVSKDLASIWVSWPEPTGVVVRYEVYRRAAVKGHAYTKIGDTTMAPYSDPSIGLVPGAEYYYRVKAVSATGAVGSWGMGNNYVRVVAPAVGNLKAVAVGGGVSVSWEQSDGDVARYKVYRRAAVKGHAYTKIGETTTASYLDQSTDLVPGTEYYYRVKPVGANGVIGGWGLGPNYASIKYR